MGRPCTLECGRVCDQGTKGHMQAETQVRGLISPTNPNLHILWLLGRKLTAPEVQSIPASRNPRAVGYTLTRQFHRAKGPPSGDVLSHVQCVHIDTGIHACIWIPTPACTPPYTPQAHTQVHVPSLTHPSMSPRSPQTQALHPSSFPCYVSPPRQGSPAHLAAPC